MQYRTTRDTYRPTSSSLSVNWGSCETNTSPTIPLRRPGWTTRLTADREGHLVEVHAVAAR